MKIIRTFVIGSYGRGNIGDDMFLDCIADLVPNGTFYYNTAQEKLFTSNNLANAVPLATHTYNNILGKIKAFLTINKIIYWGGDLWTELEGDKFPRGPLYKMVLLNTIAKIFGKKVYYAGVGAGTLEGYSLFLARLSGKMATEILFRDDRSYQLMNLKNSGIAPDIAVNLPFLKPTLHIKPDVHNKFSIVISIRYDIPCPEKDFIPFINKLSKTIDKLTIHNLEIIFTPMSISGEFEKDDIWALKKLMQRLKHRKNISFYVAKNVQDFTELVASCSLVVSVRLHANILATLSGTPCVGISYRPKVSSFFLDNKLGENFVNVSDLENLTAKVMNIYDTYDKQASKFQKAGLVCIEGKQNYIDLFQRIYK